MAQLSSEGRQAVLAAASRHQVSDDAALALVSALVEGHGNQAQFNHPDLGGMGQWSRGGMIMIGDMFNNALKARVDSLCSELSAILQRAGALTAPAQSQSQSQGTPGASLRGFHRPARWWPAEFGEPASVGAQNDMRYAYFPAARRLALEEAGRVRLYDTGEHRISGVSQQQSGSSSVTFTSQLGPVATADLKPVGEVGGPSPQRPVPPESAAPADRMDAAPPTELRDGTAAQAGDDVFAKIERLAELRGKGILTEDEYAAKKAELLARL